MTTIRKEFRRKVEERRALVIPGAFNAMSARIIADPSVALDAITFE